MAKKAHLPPNAPTTPQLHKTVDLDSGHNLAQVKNGVRAIERVLVDLEPVQKWPKAAWNELAEQSEVIAMLRGLRDRLNEVLR